MNAYSRALGDLDLDLTHLLAQCGSAVEFCTIFRGVSEFLERRSKCAPQKGKAPDLRHVVMSDWRRSVQRSGRVPFGPFTLMLAGYDADTANRLHDVILAAIRLVADPDARFETDVYRNAFRSALRRYLGHRGCLTPRDFQGDETGKSGQDGPILGHRFRWQGEVHSLSPIPWKLLYAMWGHDTCDMHDVEDEIYGQDSVVGENELPQAQKRLNKFLNSIGYPRRVSKVRRSSTLMWRKS